MIYTTSQISGIIDKITCCHGELSEKYFAKLSKGDNCECLLNKGLMLLYYREVIEQWEQNIDGSTTGKNNFITKGQLHNAISSALSLCDSCGC